MKVRGDVAFGIMPSRASPLAPAAAGNAVDAMTYLTTEKLSADARELPNVEAVQLRSWVT